tara:strand:+ start:115 stop:630 length:516 start_codon:yes stop_codon:yes gene_type:complete
MSEAPLTWETNRQRINGLWSQASWTPEEKFIWHDALSELNQQRLWKALQVVAKKYSSPKPSIKWVLTEYQRILDDEEAKAIAEKREKTQEYDDEKDRRMMDEVRRDQKMMRSRLKELDSESLERAARLATLVTGLPVSLDIQIDEWSNMAVGCTFAALENLRNENQQNRSD